jgi:hypothetical protein
MHLRQTIVGMAGDILHGTVRLVPRLLGAIVVGAAGRAMGSGAIVVGLALALVGPIAGAIALMGSGAAARAMRYGIQSMVAVVVAGLAATLLIPGRVA